MSTTHPCCNWHATGGSFLLACNGGFVDASLSLSPLAPSPTLRTYEQGVADGRAAAAAEAEHLIAFLADLGVHVVHGEQGIEFHAPEGMPRRLEGKPAYEPARAIDAEGHCCRWHASGGSREAACSDGAARPYSPRGP